MASVPSLNHVWIDTFSSANASPPIILRENMAMCCDDRTGIQMLDESVSHWWHWRNVADGVPNWSALKPFDHPKMLPHIMVYELVDDRFRCSIVGESVGSHLPVKVAGHFIDEVIPPENLQDLSKRLVGASKSGVPNFVEKTMAWKKGYDLVSYSALMLPFAADTGKNSRILSILDFQVKQMPII